MLFRRQLTVLKRQVKRQALAWRDRMLFVLLESEVPSWKQALVIVQPETVLRWHRDLFRRVWRRKSRPERDCGRPRLADNIQALMRRMAKNTALGRQVPSSTFARERHCQRTSRF